VSAGAGATSVRCRLRAAIALQSPPPMPPRPQVLVVDDDAEHAGALCAYLQRFGLLARALRGGAALRRQLAEQPPDLLVLDRHLAGDDALALTAALRTHGLGPGPARLPLILTARDALPVDRVIGLELGADDYLAKPYEPRELVARIHTVLRRTGPAAQASAASAAPAALAFDGWRIQPLQRRLTAPDGRAVALSDAEFRLLDSFLRAAGRVCSRDELAEQARGRTLAARARSIDLLVSRLRAKLGEDPQAPRLIRTVRGAGYLFDARPVPVAPG